MAHSTPAWLAGPANAAPQGFVHAPDTTAGYWYQRPENTLPPPDFWSPYARNRPLPTPGVEARKAWIVGSGIAGLAAAFYLIRDGHMPPANITILDAAHVEGGSLDGAGDAERGYLIRGGREMNWNYDNLWDLFQDVPALELPAGYSVLDEYRWVNDRDPNYSRARLMHRQGAIKDFSTFGLSRKDQWEIVRLLLKRKDEVGDTTIAQYFNKGFFETNFWALFRTMFAFQEWHSLLEMKLYLHRFLDSVDGFADMSVVLFPKYDQFDTFVRPLTRMLREQGVRFQFDTRAYDLDFALAGEQRTVTGIRAMVGGEATVLPVAAEDLVFVLPGSMTEGTAYGDMDQAPVLARGGQWVGEAADTVRGWMAGLKER
ncbi:oleate hydratase [Sphingomonas elodea]|uniref:oleate hydratase n=1 Tax=Sphingomonas elodea TaxID=179878 RepID=UPI000263030B|nr:oleate hydratase [Sphingomonas elodea]